VSMDAAKTEPRSTPVAEVARGVGWLVGTAFAVRLVETLIGRSPLGAALAGAVVVDLAMTRAGVKWDGDEDRARVRARMWRGFCLGTGITCVLVAVSIIPTLIVGGATIGLGTLSSTLLFGALRGGAEGVRDELLYRGLPIVVAERARVPGTWTIGYCALAGASPLLLEQVSFEAILQAVSLGVLFTMLWVRTKAAWAPISAHAAWFFLAGIGLRGAVLDVSWTSGMLAENGRTRGLPAVVCTAATILLTVLVSKKLAKPPEAPHGHTAS